MVVTDSMIVGYAALLVFVVVGIMWESTRCR